MQNKPDTHTRIAVCSRSFSRHAELRASLLEKYQQVTFNDEGLSLQGDELVSFLSGHDKAIVALEKITSEALDQLPQLKVISKYGVGLDGIDIVALRDRNIRLGWQGGVNKRSVSELALSFAIMLLRHLPAANREILNGVWQQKTGRLLSGKTVGIIGCGHVGKDLVSLLQPFGCEILVHDIVDYPEFYERYSIRAVGLDALLAAADVISLHVPLDASTLGMLDAQKLERIKPGACLINTARGNLVDEVALKDRLRDGRLGGAAFDVFAQEPPSDKELLTMPNFFSTPHLGGSAAEAILAMGQSAIAGLDDNSVPV